MTRELSVAERVADAEDLAFYRGAAAERKAPGDLMLPAECNYSTGDTET